MDIAQILPRAILDLLSIVDKALVFHSIFSLPLSCSWGEQSVAFISLLSSQDTAIVIYGYSPSAALIPSNRRPFRAERILPSPK